MLAIFCLISLPVLIFLFIYNRLLLKRLKLLKEQRNEEEKDKSENIDRLTASEEELKQLSEELNAMVDSLEEKNQALHHKNREVAEQALAMEEMGKIITQTMQDLEKQHENTLSSIRYAKRIQDALLPNEKTIQSKVKDGFVLYLPKDIVSGDFYWFAEKYSLIGESYYIFILGDCTGHGVPGAFMHLLGESFLNQIVHNHEIYEPSEILEYVDNNLIKAFEKEGSSVKDGMELAVCSINLSLDEIYFSGANSNLLIVEVDKTFQVLKGVKKPIGSEVHKIKGPKFETQTINGVKGKWLYMMSDGFQDQFGQTEKRRYYRKNLYSFLIQNSHEPAKTQLNLLSQELSLWQGKQEQIDDITVIGFTL